MKTKSVKSMVCFGLVHICVFAVWQLLYWAFKSEGSTVIYGFLTVAGLLHMVVSSLVFLLLPEHRALPLQLVSTASAAVVTITGIALMAAYVGPKFSAVILTIELLLAIAAGAAVFGTTTVGSSVPSITSEY